MTKTVFRILGLVASLAVGGSAIAADAPTVQLKVSDGGNGHWYSATPCPPDLNNDGEVNAADLSLMLLAFDVCIDSTNCPEDLDGNGEVDSSDMGLLLLSFGQCEVVPSLTGHVTYSDGTVATGVTVTATPTTNGNAQTVSQTDAFGNYSLNLSSATYNIDVQIQNFGFSTQGIGCVTNLEVVQGSPLVKDLVVPTVIWSGIVKNSFGEPVSGANLKGIAFASNSCCGGFDYLNVITGPDGRFSVRVHPNNYIQLTINADGYGSTYLPNQSVAVNVNSTYVIY